MSNMPNIQKSQNCDFPNIDILQGSLIDPESESKNKIYTVMYSSGTHLEEKNCSIWKYYKILPLKGFLG